MAGSLNRVCLIGRLGRDPETRALQSGSKVTSFSMAMGEKWKDKTTGEMKEQTEWARIVIFAEQMGSVAERFLRKGSSVYIEGQLRTRKYTDKDGAEREITEVVVNGFGGQLVLLDPPPGAGAGAEGRAAGGQGSGGWDSGRPAPNGGASGQRSAGGGGYGAPRTPPASNGGGGSGILDDEIPFNHEWR